ncbi:MAG: hypothetical protein JW760_10260 [Spirochaetales bacterium]|nr:hypothetical protein [Spirochaetales bacterium]
MVLFLVLAVPLFTPFIIPFCFPASLIRGDAFLAWLKGFLVFLPGVLIFSFLRKAVPEVFTPFGLYVYYLFHDYLLPLLPALAGYILLFRTREYGDYHSFCSKTLLYYAGYFAFFGIVEMIIHFMWYDPQILFLRPLLFITMILFSSSLCVAAFEREGYGRWLLLLVVPAGTALFALVPTFFLVSSILPAVLVTVVSLGAAFFLFLTTAGRLSRR